MTLRADPEDLVLHERIFQPHFVVNALRDRLQRPLVKTADGRVITAGEFRDLVSCCAQALRRLGIDGNARVGILSPNRPDVLCITAACLLEKYVLVPLHPAGSLDDHLYVVDDAEIDVLIFDPAQFSERADAIRQRTGTVKKFVSFGPSAIGVDLYELMAAVTPGPLVAPVLSGEEPYRLSYTGGTTGKPKAIVGTHRTGLAVLQIQLAEWEWPTEIRQLICAPLSHAGAAMFLPTLLRGGWILVLPNFDPLKVMEAIQEHRITCVMLVPTMIYALLDHPRLHEFDLSSLETVFYGASAMSPGRLREAIAKFGRIFFQFYGQVEAPMTITVMRRQEHDPDIPLRLASCGRPVPWLHVALLDDDCREVPTGEPGEICVRGPLVMSGYLKRPAETASAFGGGWLHTGDVAIRDEEGFFRIVDRKKDMIVTGGFNVYPREIEDVLSEHPSVSNAAVIGVPDARWGEAVKAIVVLKADARPCAEELIALVRQKKGPVQAPKTIEFVERLPLTPVGKPDKKALRRQYSSPAYG